MKQALRSGRLKIGHILIAIAVCLSFLSGIQEVFAYVTYDPFIENIEISCTRKTLKLTDFFDEAHEEDLANATIESKFTADQLSTLGEKEVNIKIKNRLFKTTFTTIDTVKPHIYNTSDFTVAKGATVAYKSSVKVSDNAGDDDVTLEVDNSKVNLNKIGNYTLTYKASDLAGNVAKKQVKVNVVSESEAPPTADEVYKVANKILKKITKEGMTKRQIAEAIYKWEIDNLTYISTSDKTSWERGAMQGFKTGRGDCFNFYSCAKALFDCAGIENIYLTAKNNPNHYWNFVKVEEGWYHFYGNPAPGYNLCLVTDDYIWNYHNPKLPAGQFRWSQTDKPASAKK
ncbi:MAG: transglutaminase domain-containing protein [Erysipelotrichaceae bacterium]|nr:transglutaminase domain-containing protein [Erysipelotrichaceae bacterium]